MNDVSMVRRAARGVATCLVLLTLGLAVPALAQPAQPGGLEVITVTPGTLTSWYVTRVRAGGPQDISSYGDSAVGPCRGFIPTSAQVRLVVTVYIGTYEAGQTPRASLGVMELPGLRGGNDESDDDDVVVAPAGRSLAIEAGPIWNNEQAQMTCAGVCAPYGTFRGGWWTTVAGAMSVCECRFDRGAMPCALEAGALWNQQQAASVCPGVCASEGGWDGNWWTTVPNQMSVCSCSACGR
jgi:hypothetical protein